MTANKKKRKAKQRRQRARALKRRKKRGSPPRRYKFVPVDESSVPAEILAEVRKTRGAEKIRNKLGIPRPIISCEFDGKRFVFIKNRSYWGNWKTFPDFLMDYVKLVIGEDWWRKELKKSFHDKHPIMQWWVETCKWQQEQKRSKDGLFEEVPNWAFTAYLVLAYDLYFLENNVEVQKELVRRLKLKGQFQGARYELFAAAACVRAGFDIQFEDEKDKSKKHVEFIATHKPTGQKVCVEAKSRHRQGVLGVPGAIEDENKIKVRIGSLFNDALKKEHAHPLVVFIDFNIPPSTAERVFKKTTISSEFKKIVTNISKTYGNRDKFNLLICTNHPFHYGRDDQPALKISTQAIVGHNPEISPKYPQVITSIFDVAAQHGKVPNEFPEDQTICEAHKTS